MVFPLAPISGSTKLSLLETFTYAAPPATIICPFAKVGAAKLIRGICESTKNCLVSLVFVTP